MKKDFTDNDLIAFIGRLANKWGTGHESVNKILDKIHKFLEEKNYDFGFMDKVLEFIEMLKAYSRKEFHIDDNSLGWIIATLAYLMLPTDLIPDFIPIIGFTDDAAAFFIAYRNISQEINRFRAWKAAAEENTGEEAVEQKPVINVKTEN
ncbi:MAG: YkvA family protein [Bacillota bacterium]